LRDFFNDTYYNGKHLLNTKGRTALVLHEGNTANSKVSVLFELKRIKNATEMLSKQINHNTKVLFLSLFCLTEIEC